MHSYLAKFWWEGTLSEKGLHWKSWEHLCKRPEEGGLGFRHLGHFNKALLAKQIWCLWSNPSSLAASIIKTRYFQNSTILEAQVGSKPSPIWRSLHSAIHLVKSGMRRLIGDGANTYVWSDSWIPRPHSFKPCSPATPSLQNMKVADLIDQNLCCWNSTLVSSLFCLANREVILSIPLNPRATNDEWRWHYTKSGTLSVASAYHLAVHLSKAYLSSSSRSPAEGEAFSKLKKCDIPPRVLIFAWKILWNVVPCAENIAHRCGGSVVCKFCGDSESLLHALKDCPILNQVWLDLLPSIAPPPKSCKSFSSWFSDFIIRHRKNSGRSLSNILWAIWSARLAVIHEEAICFQTGLDRALGFINEFEMEQELLNPTRCFPPRNPWWNPPHQNFFKINVDAGFLKG